tara:strand:+ start:257 stop:649 length:393 start_codon:yes stop_codon:yes gene_type:complete
VTIFIVLLLAGLAAATFIAYYMLMFVLGIAALALVLIVAAGVSVSESYGSTAGFATSFALFIGLCATGYYFNQASEQKERQRLAEIERLHLEALKQARLAAEEQERLKSVALQRTWHDRSLSDWKRIFFN